MLLAVVVFLLMGCSQTSTPPEQPEKGNIEEAEKQPEKEPTGEGAAGATADQESQSWEQSPKEVLASQYRYINVGDYQAAYELFDEQSQQMVSLEQYSAYFASVAPYEITSYSFHSVQVQDDTASLIVDLAVSSSEGDEQYQVTQQLVREGGSWRVVMRDAQVASFTATQAQSPGDVLAAQYQYINNGEYEKAYALFDARSQQVVSLEQYEAYFLNNAPYSIDEYSFPSVDVSGDAASVTADLSVSSSTGEDRYHVIQQLVREDGSWRVVVRDEQVAAFTGVGSASASSSPEASGGDYDATVTVSRVVDGDTVEISPSKDGTEDLRLIGVDTPETVDPEEEVEPYGPEASSFTTSELEGERVGLEFDKEKLDDYGRLLAYVYTPKGQMFNEELLRLGYAQAYPYPPNTKYADTFEADQEEARAGGLGIWGLSLRQQCQLADRGNGIGEGTAGCEGASGRSASASATSSATATSSAEPSGGGVPPISEEDCPASAPIKGNADSGIYHTQGSATYDETHPEECFATEAAARAAGYRAARD
jgi:micrococcal nuclease